MSDLPEASVTPGEKDLWFLPLGGCGEIGMNMSLYGHNQQWLMVDCGMSFERQEHSLRPKLVAADPSFIAERKSALAGIVLTHAHEDHIGALPVLWKQFPAPVYATPFTAEVLRRKAAGRGGQIPRSIIECVPGETTQIGPFTIEWLAVTHSTADCAALCIRCPAGSVLHTADWKCDSDPIIGQAFDSAPFRKAGRAGLDAVVCDSTNAAVPGRSVSEGAVLSEWRKVIKRCEGRVVVACFSSNVARMRSLALVAEHTQRYFGLLGRSLDTIHSAALATGLLPRSERLIQSAHLGYLPKHEVLALATGTQGEVGSALHKLAAANHPQLDLEEGDTLIYSARIIPGNEETIARVFQRLRERGVHIIDSSQEVVHASGHPCRDELVDMYQWLKPRLAIPVHGEELHLRANAELARGSGARMVLTGRNGDLFYLAPEPGMRRKVASIGRIELDERQETKALP
ncbi:MAG: ribonuclease J [Pseudomonadota bacterium]